MGVRGSGRRQKSASQRVVDGSKARKHHHPQPRPLDGEPAVPDWLSADERAWWTRYAELLRAQQRLSVDAGPWLLAAASAAADFMCWRAASAQAPRVITSEAGEKAHPVHIQLRLSRLALIKVLIEAGLTPASVSRVVLPAAPAEPDDFAAFQSARQVLPFGRRPRA